MQKKHQVQKVKFWSGPTAQVIQVVDQLLFSRTEAERQKNVTLARKLESTQEDLMKTQIKYF